MKTQAGLEFEHQLMSQGYRLIAGLDEAGRGAWAGPVVAGAVILPLSRSDLTEALEGVNDSKQLSARRREALLPVILEVSLAAGVGFGSHAEIDELGIVAATRLAMQRALSALTLRPQHLLIDALTLPNVNLSSMQLIKGDQRSLSIAAASILAKVTRDTHMCELDNTYPAFSFARHKGYGTALHRQRLEEYGPTPIHRQTFAPVANIRTMQRQKDGTTS